MLPNFLVIGAEKAATTTLYHHLKQHPDLFLPETKEIGFFNEYNSNLEKSDIYITKGLPWYEQFFKDAKKEKLRGEVMPMYLCDKKAPNRIKETLPDVKLIVVLRNPIDRAYSHYWMAKGKGDVAESFEKAVKNKDKRFIKRGLYFEQIQHYLRYFPGHKLKIIIYDDYISNPAHSLERVFAFLNVDNFQVDTSLKYNPSGQVRSVLLHRVIKHTILFLRKKANFGFIVDLVKKTGVAKTIQSFNKKQIQYEQIDAGSREALAQYYKQDIKKLSQYINRDLLSEWNISK